MVFIAGEYDVIVVGAGHAGAEAALACARTGLSTLLTTINLDSISLMACNPAIGGTSKGHLVREVDALGGEMGICADKTMIQLRMLNTAKGPAVHSLRAQIDKKSYQAEMKSTLEAQQCLTLKQTEVTNILHKNGRVTGVDTLTGARYLCKAVIIAAGVYLSSHIIIGETFLISGPSGLFPANHLTRSLVELGFRIKRFKTGTPARIDRRSVDFSKMEIQYGENGIRPFSFMSAPADFEQTPCYLTYTSDETLRIVRENLHRSPMYAGEIKGTGPRYCPSIEDKVVRFSDKRRHQLFIEPEGLNTNEMYVQGFSTSMPEDVQIDMLRSVIGLEKAEIMRLAYAIEYDCIDSTQLSLSLMSKAAAGLFCAGQVNGSSGYEEAAAQGLVAGINASMYVKGLPPVIIDRSLGYIGVLIDDLVTKGTNEPYRMMTSRAEYRLQLRQDNADVRLTEIGREAGLVTDARYELFLKKKQALKEYKSQLKLRRINGISVWDAMKQDTSGAFNIDIPDEYLKLLSTESKYEGYIKKQARQIEQFKRLESMRLENIDYNSISGLRLEARQKLCELSPESIGQASRISGVSPADISVLIVWLHKKLAHGETQAEASAAFLREFRVQ